MRPKSIFQVLTYTAFFGSQIYTPLLWNPFSANEVEWEEVPICFVLTLIVCFMCMLPFYILLLLFRLFKLKSIPYDGWELQAFACAIYSLFIFLDWGEGKGLIYWYLGYYPVGISFFVWYTRSKNKAAENARLHSEELE